MRQAHKEMSARCCPRLAIYLYFIDARCEGRNVIPQFCDHQQEKQKKWVNGQCIHWPWIWFKWWRRRWRRRRRLHVSTVTRESKAKFVRGAWSQGHGRIFAKSGISAHPVPRHESSCGNRPQRFALVRFQRHKIYF